MERKHARVVHIEIMVTEDKAEAAIAIMCSAMNTVDEHIDGAASWAYVEPPTDDQWEQYQDIQENEFGEDYAEHLEEPGDEHFPLEEWLAETPLGIALDDNPN